MTHSFFCVCSGLSALRCPIRFFRASASSTLRVSCQERNSESVEVWAEWFYVLLTLHVSNCGDMYINLHVTVKTQLKVRGKVRFSKCTWVPADWTVRNTNTLLLLLFCVPEILSLPRSEWSQRGVHLDIHPSITQHFTVDFKLHMLTLT